MHVLARALLAITGVLTGAHLDAPAMLEPPTTVLPAAETALPASTAPLGVDLAEEIVAAEQALADLTEVRRATAGAITELGAQLGEMAVLEAEWLAHLTELRRLG